MLHNGVFINDFIHVNLDLTMGFREELRQARKAKKLSQPALAEKIGVSAGLIQGLEAGRIQSTTKIVELALALDKPDWLAIGIDNPQIEEHYHKVKLPLIKFGEVQLWLKGKFQPAYFLAVPLMDDNKACSKRSFVMVITDDSMFSNDYATCLIPGDIVLIDPERIPEPEDVVLISHKKNEKIVKLANYGSEKIFISTNIRYNTNIPFEEAEILGVIIQRTARMSRQLKDMH